MDALVVNKGLQEKLSQIPMTSGAITFIEDSKNIYVDFKTEDSVKRVKFTDIEIINSNSSLLKDTRVGINPVPNPFENKLYLFLQSKDIWIYYNLTWTKLAGNNSIIYSTQKEILNNGTLSLNDIYNGEVVADSDLSIGSIITDKYENIGVITSLSGNNVQVKLLIDNKKQNVLTNVIYIDSSYTGDEVGTFEKPYSGFSNLYQNNLSLLQISQNKTIYIINDNSTITAQNLNNCEFINVNYNHLSTINITNSNNIVFKHMKISSSSSFDNITKLILDDIDINNDSNLEVNIISDNLTLRNCKNNTDNGFTISSINENSIISIDKCEFILNLQDINNGDLLINNSYITLNVNSSNANINIKNSEITFNKDVNINGYLNLISGIGYSTNTINISASNIYLGTFDYSKANIAFTENISDIQGLSSDQVYDKESRSYENNGFSLRNHLDAIGDQIGNINNELFNSNSTLSALKEAFVSKDTFTMISELDTVQFRVGDVLKYVGTTNINFTNTFNLTATQIESITVPTIEKDPDTSIKSTVDIPYTSITFILENAKYYVQDQDIINVTYYMEDQGAKYYDLSIYDSGDNYIKARIKTDLLDVQLPSDLSLLDNNVYNQVFSLSTGDRIIKLSNGWDKLSTMSGSSLNIYRYNIL